MQLETVLNPVTYDRGMSVRLSVCLSCLADTVDQVGKFRYDDAPDNATLSTICFFKLCPSVYKKQHDTNTRQYIV